MLKEISHAWHVEFLTRTRDPFQVRIIDVLYFKTMIRSINFALAPALSHWAQWPMEARVTQNSLTKMNKWKCYLVNSKRNSYFIYSSEQFWMFQSCFLGWENGSYFLNYISHLLLKPLDYMREDWLQCCKYWSWKHDKERPSLEPMLGPALSADIKSHCKVAKNEILHTGPFKALVD